MKLIQLLLIVIASSVNASGQSSNLFKIEVVNTKRSDRKSAHDFKRATASFYEDEYFQISNSCYGEFGGSLIFKDKASGVRYICGATCPVIINKLNDQYLVTNTLAHMRGSSEILAIDNPRALKVVVETKVEKKPRQVVINLLPEIAKPKNGITIILDSVGVFTLGSFPFDGQLYHVVTDFKTTFLAQVTQGKYAKVAAIADFGLWTYEPEMIKTVDGHYVVFYDNQKEKGYLEVTGNTLTLFRY